MGKFLKHMPADFSEGLVFNYLGHGVDQESRSSVYRIEVFHKDARAFRSVFSHEHDAPGEDEHIVQAVTLSLWAFNPDNWTDVDPDAVDFEIGPESVGELRVRRNKKAMWSPKDALVSVLREIQTGKPIDSVVVLYRYTNEGDDEMTVGYTTSCHDYHSQIGMIEDAKHLSLRDRY